MKYCPNCRQYHNHVQGTTHSCFTYEKFTYLLKDEFLRLNKEEQQMSKQSEKSKVTPPGSQHKQKTSGRTHQGVHGVSQVSSFGKTQVRSQEGALNRRIERVISKSRGCKEHHKDCSHLRSTSCDEHFSSIEQHQEQEEPLLEHDTQIELTIIPCERLFEKPFNSRLLPNTVVYDSLHDHRLCGAVFCEEGEIEGGREEVLRLMGEWRSGDNKREQ